MRALALTFLQFSGCAWIPTGAVS